MFCLGERVVLRGEDDVICSLGDDRIGYFGDAAMPAGDITSWRGVTRSLAAFSSLHDDDDLRDDCREDLAASSLGDVVARSCDCPAAAAAEDVVSVCSAASTCSIVT